MFSIAANFDLLVGQKKIYMETNDAFVGRWTICFDYIKLEPNFPKYVPDPLAEDAQAFKERIEPLAPELNIFFYECGSEAPVMNLGEMVYSGAVTAALGADVTDKVHSFMNYLSDCLICQLMRTIGMLADAELVGNQIMEYCVGFIATREIPMVLFVKKVLQQFLGPKASRVKVANVGLLEQNVLGQFHSAAWDQGKRYKVLNRLVPNEPANASPCARSSVTSVPPEDPIEDSDDEPYLPPKPSAVTINLDDEEEGQRPLTDADFDEVLNCANQDQLKQKQQDKKKK